MSHDREGIGADRTIAAYCPRCDEYLDPEAGGCCGECGWVPHPVYGNLGGPWDRTVAALFVDPKGVYGGLENVELWDEARDARTYAGPHPVVAHPPCARWSRLAGFTEARYGLKRGDDGGCFYAALDAVKTYGGVLEHPAYSAAWDAFGLPKPQARGGWTLSLLDGGASCYVEQGRYGLAVKKATWLYAYGVQLAELHWGYTPDNDGPDGGGMDDWRKRVSYEVGSATPPEFRDVLLAMARSAKGVSRVAA